MAEPKFCTVANVAVYAGANANTTSKAEAAILVYGVGAEAIINCSTRYNWSDPYAAATLNVDIKSLLSEAQCCLIATMVIQYDMSGYSSRIEAETMLDVLDERAKKCMELLSQAAVKDFMVGA